MNNRAREYQSNEEQQTKIHETENSTGLSLLEQAERKGESTYSNSMSAFDGFLENKDPKEGGYPKLVESENDVNSLQDLEYYLGQEFKAIDFIRKRGRNGISLDKVMAAIEIFKNTINKLEGQGQMLANQKDLLTEIEAEYMTILIPDWLEEFRTTTSWKYAEKATTTKLLFMAKRAFETKADLQGKAGISDTPGQLQQKMLAGTPITYKNFSGETVSVIVPTSTELVNKVEELNPDREENIQQAA